MLEQVIRLHSKAISNIESGSAALQASIFGTSSNVPRTRNDDQIDGVGAHTQKGIEHLERFGVFLKERAVIEDEYAAKLRALAKRNLSKKKEEDDLSKSFTYVSSFYAILRELESLAGQHEMVAEGLRKDIYPAVMSKCTTLRATRKNQLNELHTVQGCLNAAVDNMIKYQKSYVKAFREAETAHLKYDKAEKNMDLSRADLEKAKNNAMQRTQLCDDAKQNYAHALQAANQQQHQHYNQLLPQILEKLRAMDEERISETRAIMLQSIETETKVISIMQRCYEDMSNAARLISPSADSAIVVEQFRSGYAHPQPYPFKDLGPPSAIVTADGASSSDTIKRSAKNGTTVRVNRKPSMGLFKGSSHQRKDGADFRSYPPQQRCRRLQHEIELIEKEIAKNEQSREGASKLYNVYKDNPKLGNAGDVDSELAVYKKKIETLNQQLNKYKAMLLEAQAELNVPINVGSEPPARPPPPSQSGLSTPSQASPRQCDTPASSAPNHRASCSEESLSSEGSSALSAHQKSPARNAKAAPVVEKNEVYEECDMPALGTCTALYPFEGGSEGTMAMNEGDEMVLLERDEGDGWTRVRHVSSGREGFVPTSYLQCKWYPDQ
ncbi:Formin-binding protein 1-like [Toxocara canis]|uniref:Formin-binding protein 1-like n=1 Tax=Toxocara canis TaxID=6265 RepID=A0A0B2UNF5_TOXCA|nr:Formin-binding protein 1-like [Toxocara canis]